MLWTLPISLLTDTAAAVALINSLANRIRWSRNANGGFTATWAIFAGIVTLDVALARGFAHTMLARAPSL